MNVQASSSKVSSKVQPTSQAAQWGEAIPDDPVIGIDLGTTNSLVSWCGEAGPRMIVDEQGRSIFPSVVRFSVDGQQVQAVGHDAREHAVEYPGQTVFSIKRLMGRGLSDVAGEVSHLPYDVVQGAQDTARVQVGQRVFSPQEVSAILLDHLRQQAQRALGKPVRRAVITVPAYFDDAQRQATRDAGRLAGLEVLRIVNEPTAAALAYNLERRPDEKAIAVFDLGGGTFDVSILRFQAADLPNDAPGDTAGGTSEGSGETSGGTSGGGVSQVLATAGDTHLGGDDVDQMLMDLFMADIRAASGSQAVSLPPASRQALRLLAEQVKIRLSQDDQAVFELDLGGSEPVRRVVRRDELEALMTPWVDRAMACCQQAIRSAGLTPADIGQVVMVGGSTRIPLVRRRVAEFFQAEPYIALDPDQVVALGAGVQASILAGIRRDMLLMDVIPLSLGIETMGGAVSKLIMANTTIPARAAEQFSTYVDGQTSVKIHILQGERELVDDCRSLGRFDLRGIPPMPAGIPKIEVTFLVDANGILNVSAMEKRSEKSASIQIVPNHGLTRQEVQRMEEDSLIHAKADMTAHQLIDLRNQARLDLRAIDRQLARVGDTLDLQVKQRIETLASRVRDFMEAASSSDTAAFQQALTEMDHASVPLAEAAISQTLREANTEQDG